MSKSTLVALALLAFCCHASAQPAKQSSRFGIDASALPQVQLAQLKASLESISTDGTNCTVSIKVYPKAEATKKCMPFLTGAASLGELMKAIDRLRIDVALNSEPRTKAELDSMIRTLLKITGDLQFAKLQLQSG